ncbi:MAG: DM13 domain-containing protein [Phototrophicaceae bacterium]
MKRNQLVLLGGVIVAIIGIAITFPLWSPYFTNDVVDEAFPDFTSQELSAVRNMPEGQQTVLIDMSDENPEMANDTARAMMANDTPMDDDMPTDTPFVISEGTFTFIDAVHNGEGVATIYELSDESRVLRFENFRVTNGPQLHVILSRNSPTSIFGDVGDDYIDLGALSGNVGNQNYIIPDDVNLDEYQTVVIYCVPYNVVFSTAPLGAPAHGADE